ncbi:MAG: TonB-dependent receptor [Bacteroidales bacterium]
MKTIIIGLMVLLGALNISAQNNTGRIKGKVKSDNAKAPYVNVLVKGTSQGTTTDEEGNFIFHNLEAGSYTLVIKGIGYKDSEKAVEIEAGTTREVNLTIEPDLINMDAVVVSANRHETSRYDSPVIVNTMDHSLFETTQSVSLAEGLHFTPGLRLENNCQNCGFTQLRMNGLQGPYTQILINSRPVFSALAGVYGLEQIPASMIERVEVVRGGGSALYGGNAIAGTINIITSEPYENSWHAGFQQGLIDGDTPDRVFNANASLVSEDGKSGLFLFGLLKDREPYNANPDELWDADGDGKKETKDSFSEIGLMESRSFGLNAFYRPWKNSKISADMYNLNEFRRGGNKFDQLPHHADITEQAATNMLGGGVSFETFTSDQKHKFSLYTSAQQLSRDTYYGAEQDPDAYGATSELISLAGVQYGGNYKGDILIPSMLTAGVEWKQQDLFDKKLGQPNVVVADQQIQNLGVYLQNVWDLRLVTLQLGMRFDQHTNMDNSIYSPRINLLHDINDNWQLRAGYATGFRPPQIFSEDLHIEVAGARRVITRVDEKLKAETSGSYTASVDYTGKIKNSDFYALAESFYTDLQNAFVSEIMEDQTGETVIMFRTNGSGATVGGLNLEINYVPLKNLLIESGFTWQQSVYNEKEVLWEPESGTGDSVVSTKNMLRSPDTYGFLNVRYSPGHDWTFSMNGTYTGRMLTPHLVNPENEYTRLVETPLFFNLDARVSYHLHLEKKFSVELFTGVKNILNSYQSDFDAGINRDAGYIYGPLAPRTFVFGIKAGMFR